MKYLILFVLTTNLSFAACQFTVNLLEKCPSKESIAAMQYQKKFFADLAARKAAKATLIAKKEPKQEKTTKPVHKG